MSRSLPPGNGESRIKKQTEMKYMTLKDKVLGALLDARGEELSGQALAGRFGVSRSAVWKAVKTLRAEGADSASGTNRGYRLSPDCDLLSAEHIRALLGDTLPVYVYQSIDSTSSECKRRLSQGEERCLVLATEQTGGRGRRGKSFFSPGDAGLYMSLAMPMDMSLSSAVGVTAYAAVCVCGAIREVTGRKCGIKWVNDLYLDGKKVCGILSEAVTGLEAGDAHSVVIGVGVNLHPCTVPPELEDIVGFLGCGPVKNELCAAIVSRLQRFDPADKSYMDEYRAQSVVLGREVRYCLDGVEKRGCAEQIGDDGALHVRTSSGVDVLRGGEVSLTGIK